MQLKVEKSIALTSLEQTQQVYLWPQDWHSSLNPMHWREKEIERGLDHIHSLTGHSQKIRLKLELVQKKVVLEPSYYILVKILKLRQCLCYQEDRKKDLIRAHWILFNTLGLLCLKLFQRVSIEVNIEICHNSYKERYICYTNTSIRMKGVCTGTFERKISHFRRQLW